jgi:endonuclease/exonuclease/phosphatase family metal-dependent hydrolase
MTELKIISYNLRDYGKNPFDRDRHQRQVALLRELAPNILCIQEFWDDSPGHQQLVSRFEVFAGSLGMQGMVVPAPRTHCHLGLLWQKDITQLDGTAYQWHLWHGLGLASFDVGAKRPLRVAVTHLGPWDPQHRFGEARDVAWLAKRRFATIVGADWNSLPMGDPEPDWTPLSPDQIEHHVLWNPDPSAPLQTDRRPAQLLDRVGLTDAATHLGVPWQPTAGHMGTDVFRRPDAFRCSELVLPALRGYRVHDSPDIRELSNHLPIELTADAGAIA